MGYKKKSSTETQHSGGGWHRGGGRRVCAAAPPLTLSVEATATSAHAHTSAIGSNEGTRKNELMKEGALVFSRNSLQHPAHIYRTQPLEWGYKIHGEGGRRGRVYTRILTSCLPSPPRLYVCVCLLPSFSQHQLRRPLPPSRALTHVTNTQTKEAATAHSRQPSQPGQ